MVLSNLFPGEVSNGQDDDDLNDGEMEVLRSAGVIGNSSRDVLNRKHGHIIFVDNDQEGTRSFGPTLMLLMST